MKVKINLPNGDSIVRDLTKKQIEDIENIGNMFGWSMNVK